MGKLAVEIKKFVFAERDTRVWQEGSTFCEMLGQYLRDSCL